MNTAAINRKPIFDRIRKILGRGFRPAEVAALDAAIDVAIETRVIDAPSTAETPDVPGRISPVGIAMLHKWEGCARKRQDGRIEAYPDPGTGGKPWTIGWGTTRENGRPIQPGTVWSQEKCDQVFEAQLRRYAEDVVKALGPAIANTSQEQFDALVSFHYNTGAIGRSTLTRKHVAGDHAGAAREFRRWNRAGGRPMRGLTRRRADEERLYRTGM